MCASSCVPASPFESAGAELLAADVRALLEVHGAIGVAEVMNFPGVIAGDPDLVAKIAAAGHRRVDGHAPGLGGAPLDAYLAAGVESDHECTQLDEAEEKRRKGMWVFVREGSSTKNLADLIPMVLRGGTTHVALCTDDREPDLILARGHVNDCVRLAVAHGVSIEDALVLATHERGRVPQLPPPRAARSGLPGRRPRVRLVRRAFAPARVWQRGRLVAVDGAVVDDAVTHTPAPEWMLHSVHLAVRPEPADLDLAPPPGGRARVIGIIEAMITTEHLVVDVTDPARRRRADRRARAAPGHRPDRARLGLGLRARARRDGFDRCARRAQLHGRGRARRAAARARWRRRWHASPRSAAVRSRCSTDA